MIHILQQASEQKNGLTESPVSHDNAPTHKLSQNQISALRRAINRYGPFFVKNPAVKVYLYEQLYITFVK